MAEGAEAARWDTASHLLAMLRRCQSEGGSKLPYDHLGCNVPYQREIAVEKAEQERRDRLERKMMLANPELLAKARADKAAEFARFRAAFR